MPAERQCPWAGCFRIISVPVYMYQLPVSFVDNMLTDDEHQEEVQAADDGGQSQDDGNSWVGRL